MNITLRCRGSKREQARPPICAARWRPHRRGPIGRTVVDAADLILVALTKLAPHHLVAGALILRVVGGFGFHHIAVDRALLIELGRRGRAEAVRAGGRRRCQYRSAPCSSVSSDIGTPSSLEVQIADQRHAISAFGVALAPSATESPPESSSQASVSLGIVGHTRWDAHYKPLP
jgi:hypothetical protein